MPNGRPGDHPLTDVFMHHLPVFPPRITQLLYQLHDCSAAGANAVTTEFPAWLCGVNYSTEPVDSPAWDQVAAQLQALIEKHHR